MAAMVSFRIVANLTRSFAGKSLNFLSAANIKSRLR
jgi:hypothetical protein